MEWVFGYKWKDKYAKYDLIYNIYTFMIYRKMIKTFDDECKYILNENIVKYGFEHGVKMAFVKVSIVLSNRHMDKNKLIHDEANKRNKRIDMNIVSQRMEEDKRWKSLSDEEIRKRNGNIAYGERDNWVLNDIIYEGKTGGYKYRIYEKSYGFYNLTISCLKTNRVLYHCKSKHLYGYNGVYGDLLDRAIERAKLNDNNEIVNLDIAKNTDDEIIQVGRASKKNPASTKGELRKIFEEMGLPTDGLD